MSQLGESNMMNLYQKQTFLVGAFLLFTFAFAFSQLSTPINVFVKSSGSNYSDQFPAFTDFTYGIVQEVSPFLGAASIEPGGTDNTLKVTFTPNPGKRGTTELIVTYYSLSAPVHPVTRAYRFHIADDVVWAADDRYVVDKESVEVPMAVLENDSATTDVISISKITAINSGTASISAGGDTILYTPEVGFTGETWIQYIACDTSGNCGKANVQILVRNQQQTENFLQLKKSLLNQEVLEILTPFEGYTVDVLPSNGTLETDGGYHWTYVADEGFTGKDTFRISLTGFFVREYIISVFHKSVNIQALDDKFYVRPGLSVTFNVLNNDLLDFDLVAHTNPTRGTLSNHGNGTFTYTPSVLFRGVDKFTYTTCYEDTVYCETATVLLHVTDLEPENTFTYKLQTSEELPMVIDHPVAYTDYSYIINQHPENGTLNYYAGVQSFELGCQDVDGYNYLIYQPDNGYVGQDHFEYYYCVHPSNLCYLVKIDVDVVAAPESENCPCVVNCVWPGDANLDGRVDMSDLLVTGYYLGETGIARQYDDPASWFGQNAEEWAMNPKGMSLRHADANGDGVIDVDDIEVIDTYYDRTNDVVVKDVQQKLPYQFSLIPVQFSLDSGDVVILDVSIGTANNPIIDLNGTKFSITVPAAMMDSASTEVIFHPNSWVAERNPFISLGKIPYDGRIDGAISKANGKGASGSGVLATIIFIVEDDVEGFKSGNDLISIPVTLKDGAIMGLDGVMYDVEGHEIVLTYNPHGKKVNEYTLITYPNPARDLVNVHINGKTEIQSVEVFDVQGRVMAAPHSIDGKHATVQTDGLAPGLYYIRTQHNHGVLVEAITVIK